MLQTPGLIPDIVLLTLRNWSKGDSEMRKNGLLFWTNRCLHKMAVAVWKNGILWNHGKLDIVKQGKKELLK